MTLHPSLISVTRQGAVEVVLTTVGHGGLFPHSLKDRANALSHLLQMKQKTPSGLVGPDLLKMTSGKLLLGISSRLEGTSVVAILA